MFASQRLLRTFDPITRSYASSGMPADGPRYGFTPAFSTRMSMPPQCATVWSTRFCSSSLRPIWQGMTTALPPFVANARRHRLAGVGLAAGDHHGRAMLRHAGGDRQADALGGTGDDSDFTGQIEQRRHRAFPLVPVACRCGAIGCRTAGVEYAGRSGNVNQAGPMQNTTHRRLQPGTTHPPAASAEHRRDWRLDACRVRSASGCSST